MTRPYCQSLLFVLLLAPAGAWAGKLTCLTGTDPSVADDLPQITAVRADVDAACPCASFDGSKGKTHAKYASCANGVVGTQASAGKLRTQCKATVKKYYSVSTCGVPASKGDAPCIKASAAGKVTCSIKPSTKCPGTPCASFTTCIDAADTNGDGLIGAGDSGACVSSVAPTATPAPTNTPPPPASTPTHTFTFTPAPPTATFTPAPRFVDNGDGTITDNQTGLMWEKKDQAGGLHDSSTYFYIWAGLCGCLTGSCTGSEPLCQPDASSASLCSAATGGALGCSVCASGTCNVAPFGNGASSTIWFWLEQLNASNFAGHSNWQIPTVGQDGGTMQLETIIDTNVFGCGSGLPCVPAVFNTNCTAGCTVDGNGGPECSCTKSGIYWSATTYAALPIVAWLVNFNNGDVGYGHKDGNYDVRAVR